MNQKIEFTRQNRDVNGNPRYAFHFLELINEGDRIQANKSKFDIFAIDTLYSIALQKAKLMHGRKYHNKKFGGGIIIQSYNTAEDQELIQTIREVNTNFKKELTPKEIKKLENNLFKHLMGRKYKYITDHSKPGQELNFSNNTMIENLLGLAYTSTGDYAGLWVCNGVYCMVNDTHHLIGITLNERDNPVLICEDEEENTIYIELW